MYKTLKKLTLLSLLVLITAITGCYPVLQSAELTPPKKISQTIRTGAFVDDYFINDDIFPQGFGYHIGYGINENLEVNSEVDLFWPRVSIGAKTKLIDKLAFSANLNASVYEEIFYYPDFSLIYGYKTYCGTKVIVFTDGKEVDYSGQIFVGKKYDAFNKFKIIPEVSLNFSGYLNLGLGLEF